LDKKEIFFEPIKTAWPITPNDFVGIENLKNDLFLQRN